MWSNDYMCVFSLSWLLEESLNSFKVFVISFWYHFPARIFRGLTKIVLLSLTSKLLIRLLRSPLLGSSRNAPPELTAAHSSSAFLSLCYWEPTTCNYVTVSSCTNHISCYICHQRARFPRNGSLLLIGQFKERNAELEWAAVSWGRSVTWRP